MHDQQAMSNDLKKALSEASPVSVASLLLDVDATCKGSNHEQQFGGYDTESTCAESTCASSIATGSWSAASAPSVSTGGSSPVVRYSKRRRKVKFAEVGVNRSPVTSVVDDPEPLTQEEKHATFWKNLEFKLFRQYSKKMVIATYKTQGIKAIIRVYSLCTSTEPWDNACLGTSTCAHVSNTPIRGLEVVAHGVMLDDRREAIQKILAAHRQIPVGQNDADEVLRSTCLLVSRSARRLARVFGHSDQVIATRVHSQEPRLD